MSTNKPATIGVEQLNKLLDLFDHNFRIIPHHTDASALESVQYHTARRNYIVKLREDADEECIKFIDAIIGETARWFRPDWTPKTFLEVTSNMNDADRCKAALLTRDIPLISWFVNARAGRKQREGVMYVEEALMQTKINESEVAEIRTAIEKQDPKLFLDAVSDTLLTTAGYAGWSDLSLTDNFLEMITANFTRIASTREEATVTQRKWLDFGVKCRIDETEVGTFPVIVTEEITIDGERYSKGKFLKGANFTDNDPSAALQFVSVEQAKDLEDTARVEERKHFNLGNPNAYDPLTK